MNAPAKVSQAEPDPLCTCKLPPDVRVLNGWHIRRVPTEAAATDMLYEKLLAAEPKPRGEKRMTELWQEAVDMAPRYVGSNLALCQCPKYAELEAVRVAAVRRAARRNSGRMAPRSEE